MDACPAIQLQRFPQTGLVVVSISIAGQWVDVLRCMGDFINERVEPDVIRALVIASKLRSRKNDPTTPVDTDLKSPPPRDQESKP